MQQTDFHSPNVPGALGVGKDHILIYMTSNDSVEEITRITITTRSAGIV